MSAYDTNLAAEYYILSCLHRMGVAAALTLGNKKGVDILVARDAGDAITVEVKGVAKKYDWPADNLQSKAPDRHFVALVSFESLIEDPAMPRPRVWIIPYPAIERFTRQYQNRPTQKSATVRRRGRVGASGRCFLDTGLTVVPGDGCAGGSLPDCRLRVAQPHLNLVR